ncbi:hypothetical protein [Acidiphilium sp.]|uniref:hypothetical protein n=1 Tax=Acidiphilium sp. TaxID=527 RepID=UPI003D04DF78
MRAFNLPGNRPGTRVDGALFNADFTPVTQSIAKVLRIVKNNQHPLNDRFVILFYMSKSDGAS